jgi:transposase
VTLTIADTRGPRGDDGVVSSTGANQPRRRVFTVEYKLRMVAEYDRAAHGEGGALLRREGLYYSHIIEWRKARDAGTLVARPVAEPPEPVRGMENEQGAPRRRRRGGSTAEQAEVERLRRQNEKLASDLAPQCEACAAGDMTTTRPEQASMCCWSTRSHRCPVAIWSSAQPAMSYRPRNSTSRCAYLLSWLA